MPRQTRRVMDTLSVDSRQLPAGKIVGAECENGHQNREIALRHAAPEGKKYRCVDCGALVTQTLLDDDTEAED